LEFLHVAPGGNGAAKAQPPANPKDFHASTAFAVLPNLLKTNVLSPENNPKTATQNKALTNYPKMGF
jgi:hypothetical protein